MSDRITDYEGGGAAWDGDDGEDLADVERTVRWARRRAPEIELLLEDERFVVVNKPAGLPTVRRRFRTEDPTVLTELDALLRRRDPDAPRPVVCHRLDMETSGCLVVARDRETARGLMQQFRKGEVTKTYLALVTGGPQPPEGELTFRVGPNRQRPGSMLLVRKGGKLCHSTYETVEAFRGISLVRVRPTSGRMHEVRLAVKSLGTPCAVDPLYGTTEPLLLSRWKRSYRTRKGKSERPLVERLTLHAESIEFLRPGTTDDRVAVEAPLSRDLAAALRQLRKHAAPGSL